MHVSCGLSCDNLTLDVYPGYQMLRDAGDVVLPVTTSTGGSFDETGPLTVMATKNTTASRNSLAVFLGNFPLQDGGAIPLF